MDMSKLLSLIDQPAKYFAECDRIHAIPLTEQERPRWQELLQKAQTVGLVGKERSEFYHLDCRSKA